MMSPHGGPHHIAAAASEKSTTINPTTDRQELLRYARHHTTCLTVGGRELVFCDAAVSASRSASVDVDIVDDRVEFTRGRVARVATHDPVAAR